MNRKVSPIAIVGMAFRFPGDLSDEHGFWQALRQGRDVITQIGDERWPTDLLKHPKRSESGRSISFAAGVLSRIDEFDAGFFGISPREAAWLDPQQRLLLELAWEAIENSGLTPSSLAGSDCAVYVGIAGVDYGMRTMTDLPAMSAHSMTGNTFSIAANRLSYVFDLHGPSVAVDTACSSSLVALHHACNSLRSGESSVALVGGVNLLLHPYPFIGFTKASMLSANGRCRAFDASGDGYVRAEGGAVLMLKPLAQAVADGDPIEAVIMASGANADGSRKTGLTIPSSQGQAELMRAVLKRSGLAAADVDYIEAHGTGTAVGDPIEAAAIGEVYGRCRSPARRLPIGSVKTNIGHLEAASGLAGLAKAVLILKNRALPPSLHCVTRNPNIDFDGMNLDLVDDNRPFPKSARKKLIVGVNSFAFGGANAHVLLQEFSPRKKPRKTPSPAPAPAPLFLSARTPQALRELAGRYATLLREQPEIYYDLAYSAAKSRDRLEKRLAVRPGTAMNVADQLARFADGETVAQVVVEDAPHEPGSVAFIYTGNGSQWLGMGRRLIDQSPRFAAVINELDAMIGARTGFSIVDELHADTPASQIDDTAVAQPLLFAIQVALTELFKDNGITPQGVAGHSVGEVAAAWASGALTLEQAVDVICARSAAQTKTRGLGRMAAVGLSEDAARQLLAAEQLTDIVIAGINSPHNVTVTGPLASLQRLGEIVAGRSTSFHLLSIDYAFHSPAMDAIQEEVTTKLSALTPQAATAATFVSTVSGEVLSGETLDAAYWWRNVRQPVLFSQAVQRLVVQGCRVFVEIGPRAILQRYMRDCLATAGISGRILPTLRRDHDGIDRVEAAILHVHLLREPHALDVYFATPGCRVRLPNYPWQRERHWHPRTSEGNGALDNRRVHPLLGWRLNEAPCTWENALDPESLPWLADHRVAGAIVFPGAAYVEMALAAGREHFGGGCQEIEQLDILVPLVFDGEHSRSLRFELAARDGSFTIRSRQRLSADEWTLNAAGRLIGAPTLAPPVSATADIDAVANSRAIDRNTHYQLAQKIGLEYGPAFQGLQRAVVQGCSLRATIVPATGNESTNADYLLHPTLLDLCFQSVLDFFQAEIEAGDGLPLLPVKIGRLRLYGDAPVIELRTWLKRSGARSVAADFELLDANGDVVALLEGCRFKAAALTNRNAAEPACWQLVPRLMPLAAEQHAIHLPPTKDIAKRVLARLAGDAFETDRSAYFRTALPLLEALTVAFVRDAFERLFADASEWLQAALDDPAHVDAPVRSLFSWSVEVLTQEELLVKQSSGIWGLEDGGLPPAPEIWRTLLRDHAATLPELVLTGSAGRHLADALGGKVDGRVLAEKMQGSRHAEALFDHSPAYLGTRLAIGHILSTLAADWPGSRRLRVLEVVAGTSGALSQLLAAFPENRLDYVLTHFDDEACARLQAEHAKQPSVTVAKFDREASAFVADAGLPEYFDVIVLRHCLHAVPGQSEKLALVHSKLAAGGLLLLAERHADLNPEFLTSAALTAGEEADTDRVMRLRSPKAWQYALEAHGFDDIGIVREPSSEGLEEGAYLLLAKRPADEQAIRPSPFVAATWLLVCDASQAAHPLAERLRGRLESEGQLVTISAGHVTADVGIPTLPVLARATLATARQTLDKIDHIVYLAAAGVCPALAESATLGALDLVQAIDPAREQPRLWLVTVGTTGASSIPGNLPSAPELGALWGFGRVVMNEYPALACTLINLDFDATDSEAVSRLQMELLQADGEKEVLLSSRGRHALRMEPVVLGETHRHAQVQPRFRLDFHTPGQLRNVIWLPNVERALGDGEVEVRVMASGLNFRDVMYLMGLLPDEAVENGFAGASLGLEFSGIITRLGERAGQRAGDLAVGDAVMGFGPACFASHVVTQANALTVKPADWSFAAAATVPTVFFTVYYALKHLGDLQPGERVLIHGAAGGVGIAAVQLALHLGAEVFATAGSEEKRDFVKLLGADHVLDSRSFAFADEILALTGGEGVDVVLNSLAGEAIRRNLNILKPFGRLLELGKRDFFENTPIGLRPFKDNISYFGIDADQLLLARPTLAARLFREVMALFREGVLFPLPYRAYSAEHIVDAFRHMQQSRHIGKVVVTMDNARVAVQPEKAAASRIALKSDATWLVTGGLSGFGLESARWLAARGVGNLVLVNRRGIETPGARQAVQQLEALGVRVRVRACDIANHAAVQQLLAEIRRDAPPLTGILHAAMALDDGLISGIDAKRLHKVFAPKVMGAWHLHNLTQDLALEHFVLYSSMTTFIGNPGQASYVAANTALESLAALRHSQGLPATCIAWGPIGDAGYLTRNDAVKEALAIRLGRPALASHNALDMLDRALLRTDPSTAVVDFDWTTLSAVLPAAQEPRFEALRRQSVASGDAGNESADIQVLIAGKTPDEAHEVVRTLVMHEVAQILCVATDRIDPARSLHDLGMDSLMGMELALALEKRFTVRLPAMLINEGPTVERIAMRIVERLLGNAKEIAEQPVDGIHATVALIAAQHGEHMSVEEVAETAHAARIQAQAGG